MMDRRQWMAGMALAAGMAAAQRARAGRPLVLGQSLPLEGPLAPLGRAFGLGARLQLERAAVQGVPLQLRQLDDGGDPVRAAANARRLLDEGADLLFGFVGTACCEAGATVARQRGSLLFAPFGAADKLRGPAARHVLHVRPGFLDEARRMVRHCATLGQERLAVLGEEDAMGLSGLAAVIQAVAEQRRPPLLARTLVPATSNAADEAVERLVALQPQAVIQPSQFAASAAFVRRLRQAGWRGSCMNFSPVGIAPLAQSLGEAARGVVVAQALPSPRQPATPLVREYLQALGSTGAAPGYEGLEGFVAARTLLRVAQRSGATQRAALHQALLAAGAVDLDGLVVDLRAGPREAPHPVGRPVELLALRDDGQVLR